ncbi:hypothetical protein SAMN05660652_02603 [Propionivibrio dicarboxylicus]|uniref:Uncharacterized protein n=1 Tax=Propionivibrio dicarboxylicus TaxID=83767 RepID=A0A1G8GQ08_9RHOO|nr:hypothetical protein SAMN05660652_02603 [Propionivibrio dicarboxylicus]
MSIGLWPMFGFADVHYQCTGVDGFRDYQIRRCAKGMESTRITTPPFDVRSMESGALVLQCEPCTPGHAWRWLPVASGTGTTPPADKKGAAGLLLPPPPPTANAAAPSGSERCPPGTPETLCKGGLAVSQADIERFKKEIGVGALLNLPK